MREQLLERIANRPQTPLEEGIIKVSESGDRYRLMLLNGEVAEVSKLIRGRQTDISIVAGLCSDSNSVVMLNACEAIRAAA
jgi:hypothetical protein